MEQARVPEFGNWGSEENYTAYFDKARKGKRGGKIVNPNNPHNNQDAISDVSPVRARPPKNTDDSDVPSAAAVTALKPKHERRAIREEDDVKQVTDTSASHDTPHQQHGERAMNPSDPHRRGYRTSSGPDRSVEHSPLHPHYNAKATSKGGVSSPSWERKGSSEGSHGMAPSTPAGSRLRSAARGDETPERGAAVPKFGDWDESDPASADGFTHIFNKVKEERQMESAKIPTMPAESPYHNNHKQSNTHRDSTNCCCFGWSKN